MENPSLRLTVLGARGSMAVSGEAYNRFGGATSCYLVQCGENSLFLDAGSGLVQAPAEFPRPPAILLSHLHLDHLLGLGMYPRLSAKGLWTDIYVPVQLGEDPAAVLDGVFSPPFWPLRLSGYAGNVTFHPLAFPLRIGELNVEGIPGNHPGGCAVMKVSARGKSLVYATDYEYSEASFEALARFAEQTDLLLFDAQYTEEEFSARRGFGHSTAALGVRLANRCGARRLLLIHHDPHAGDDVLMSRQETIDMKYASYAMAGEVIEL